MFKFLPGLILLQAITVGLLLIAPENLTTLDWLGWAKVLLPVAISAILMSFWFNSLAAQRNQDEVLRLKEAHLKECEEIRTTLQNEIFQLKESHAEKHEKLITTRQDEVFSLKEAHAKEREKIRVSAERAKHRITKEAQKQVEKEIRSTSAKANFKVGAVVAGAVGLGGLLVLTQFVALGVMVLTTAGGTMGGYLLRYKQERTRQLPSQKTDSIKVVEPPPKHNKKLLKS